MIPCSPRGSQGTGRGGPLGGQAGRGRSKQAGSGRIHKQSSQNRGQQGDGKNSGAGTVRERDYHSEKERKPAAAVHRPLRGDTPAAQQHSGGCRSKKVNVSNIRTVPQDTPSYAPGPVAHDESNNPLYEVEFIVGHSTLPGTKHTSQYVKYKGYNVPEWNDLKNVQHLHILLDRYFKGIGKPVPAK